MKVYTQKQFQAMQRQQVKAQPTKYSTLKIIRALGQDWVSYRNMLQAAGYLDQFFAANYLSSEDPVFQQFMQLVPQQVKEKLQDCIWDPQ